MKYEDKLRKLSEEYQNKVDDIIADYFKEVIPLRTAKDLLEDYLPKAKVARDIYFNFVEQQKCEKGDNKTNIKKPSPSTEALLKSYVDIQQYVESRLLNIISKGSVYASIFKHTKEEFEETLNAVVDLMEIADDTSKIYIDHSANDNKYHVKIEFNMTDSDNFGNRFRYTICSPDFDTKQKAQDYLKSLNIEEVL